jgi:hypothetical protein
MLAEVRFRRERLDLYRARVYSGHPTNPKRAPKTSESHESRRAQDR